MAKADITPKYAREILERRIALKSATTKLPADFYDLRFPQQRRFIEDPAKLKALFSTRRAAKSYTAGLYMVRECLLNPYCNCLFVGLSFQSTKRIIWKDILVAINDKYKLHMIFNQSALTVTFPNKSMIWCLGVDADENEMKKALGSKYRLACIDEASLYTIDTYNFVYGILKPAVADPNSEGERGTIIMTGTSSDFTRGLFYDITTGKEPGWSLHSWTAHDNPYVSKQWQEELDEIAKNRPLYKNTPQFKQWYLNEWVVDEEKLVYKYSHDLNWIRGLPEVLDPNGWIWVLGVDTGWEDDNAFVLAAYHEHDCRLYIVECFAKPRMTFDQVVERVRDYMGSKDRVPCKVIIDGANKQGVESMKQRSAIPFTYAEKADKVSHIEMMNADLLQGKIKILPTCTALIKEMQCLVWRTDGGRLCFPKKEHPNLSNHLCDAALYAWRHCYQYHASAMEDKVTIGSNEWYKKFSEDIWEREYTHLMEDQNGEWSRYT